MLVKLWHGNYQQHNNQLINLIMKKEYGLKLTPQELNKLKLFKICFY
jgi:hypothetical protein